MAGVENIRTTKVQATSRASVKVKDNLYTVEYSEERSLPDTLTSEEIVEAREVLWDICNAEVDAQIETILKTFK